MSKNSNHGYRKQKIAILTLLGISSLAIATAYAVTSQEVRNYILRVAGSYANVEGMKQYYDGIANNSTMGDVGKIAYFTTLSEVHRGVANIHNQLADFADERIRSLGGVTPNNPNPTNTGSTNSGSTNSGSNSSGGIIQIDNSALQVQFYGIPYGVNSRGTVTRGRDYDGYYGLSNKIREEGPFACKAWYSITKDKTRGREMTFYNGNSVSNTSINRTDKLVMKIDFASDVTETLLKVTCSGLMGGTWRTLEYNETFTVVSPAKAVIGSFQVSNANPNPSEQLSFSWQTTGAVGCSISQAVEGGVRFSIPGQSPNGMFTRAADTSGTSTYRLICTNPIGEDTQASEIRVTVKGSTSTGTTSSPSCGTSNGKDFVSAPNTSLCTLGNPSPSPANVDPANASKWKWSCSLGSAQVTCSANKISATSGTGGTNTGTTNTGNVLTPECGPVNNGSYMTVPTTYLCNVGLAVPSLPTLDTTTNKWKWSCDSGGKTVACSANKSNPITNLGQFAFSPQCNGSEGLISLGSMSAASVTTNYNPQSICRIPTNIPSNIFNYLTDLVEPIDMIGTDGEYNWGCMGINQNGEVDGNMVECRARKLIDAQCGPYNGVARTSFDELDPGIRGGPVPDSLKLSYCTVGEPTHYNSSIQLDNTDFGFFHWECRSKDMFVKQCKAPYEPSKVINFTASKSTISAGESVTFNWSLPKNTAYVKCYPVTDYRAQGNSVYDFYNGSKILQGSFSQSFSTTTVMSLYCAGKTNDVSDKKEIVITVGVIQTPKSCAAGTTSAKSPDGQNSCNFAWGQTDAGKSASAVTTTGGGVLNGVCGNDGNWASWSLSCPNKTQTVTCAGGGATFYSNNQSNTCVASFEQRNVGQSVTIGNGLTITSGGPAATGSATCKSDGSWTYNVNCPSKNTAVKTCPGGSEQLPSPSGNKTCVASWNITNANTWASATVTNGGYLRAKCDANGDWTSVDWKCPD